MGIIMMEEDDGIKDVTHAPSLREVSYDSSRSVAEIQDRLASGFLLHSRIDAGRSGGRSERQAAADDGGRRQSCVSRSRVIDDAHCRVLVQGVGPASVQCLPSVVSQEPARIVTLAAIRFSYK
ncbi:hypothetical protein DAPPUDRAFT_100544 [Daphnia pulex]|uniref:Uncharacterized protein n=1 Tax=Daphnia pulex TaxID=6669 RepID=E9GAP1_DAPPU|nr:hypothetical protein DAPPUDRAFT_100544 [Daphnia pulex]|eukprot:EFX83505.1 hypothetical protein DAPPUDRAFT_100544 [Daphnia pulex]